MSYLCFVSCTFRAKEIVIWLELQSYMYMSCLSYRPKTVKVAYYSFSETLVHATIGCQTSVFVARAKMMQVTSRSNKTHFRTWKASNLFGICSDSFKLRSNLYSSLEPKKYGKKSLRNILKRALIYSCFLTRNTWRHMSARLNKGHAQFNSL